MQRYFIVLFFCIVTAEYTYRTKWFKVPLDHFGYHRNETFKIRYLENDDHWDKESGPIFIYTGNEAPISLFAQHTGFMWDIAPEYKAKVVFVEHRYYGASLPFGNQSWNMENIDYLNVEQTLADYAELINYLQGDGVRPKYPVVAFGGSYGGILATYMRLKYPHIVIGAIAASAPIHMYPGMVPCDVYHRITTYTFNKANEKCGENIKNSWHTLRTFLSSRNTSEWLEKQWKLCFPVKTPFDIDTLISFLVSMYDTLAMVNYPYPTDFLMPLPENPVKTVCQHLSENLTGKKLLEGIGKVVNIYTNYTEKSSCIDYKNGFSTGPLQMSGWGYQKCTEMVMPRCATGKEDMFEPIPWNLTQYSDECYKKYQVRPRPHWTRIEFGGNQLQAASNIVFSNGLLDPWAGGGILSSISDTVIAVVLIDAAHHLDLMPSNALDPQSVKLARNIHKQNIDQWLFDFREQNSEKLEPFGSTRILRDRNNIIQFN